MAFLTSALIGSGLAATLGAGALAAGAVAGSMALSGRNKSSSGVTPPGAMPTAPSYGSASTAAEKALKARKKTSTILTSPLTGAEDYGSAAPTLLGSGTGKTQLGA